MNSSKKYSIHIPPAHQKGNRGNTGDTLIGVYMSCGVLVFLWITYFFIHSAMISITATEYMKRALGERYRFYRLFYNAVAIVTFIPVAMYTRSLDTEPVFRWTGYLKILQVLLISIGILLIVSAVRKYDMLQALGVRQIFSGASHRVLAQKGEILDTGILGLVRHPLYLAVLLLIWTRNLSVPFLIVNVIMSAYLIIGTILEEHKLIVEFGNAYKEYKQRVSMLFPYKWIMKKIG
jgi:protein-S-isoprenylcysteine O-methyltransferase Ste14